MNLTLKVLYTTSWFYTDFKFYVYVKFTYM
jgi:hypothetical protein